MTAIALVVIISFLEGVTAPIGSLVYEDASWLDYINKQVELDDYDKDKARTAKDDTKEVADEMTAHYDQPLNFRKEMSGIAPFVSLLYTEEIITTDRDGKKKWSLEPDAINGRTCGGAVLTRNVVLTICACVHTFLFKLDQKQNRNSTLSKDTDTPHKTTPYDFAHKDIYVLPFTENVFDHIPSLTYYDTLFKKYKIDFNYGTKYAQYHNSGCVKIISLIDKYKWDKPGGNGPQLLEEMTRTFVLLKYTPDFDKPVPDWYVPWPPVVIPYDTVRLGNRHKNALNYGRNVQSVTVFSYAFKQWLNKTQYRTEHGKPVDVYHSLMAYRTSLCDQYHCARLYLDNKTISEGKLNPRYESLGCFCDNTKNELGAEVGNTLCGGMIGSPAIYEGQLYGLIVEPLPCVRERPRTLMIRGFTDKMVQNYTNAVPDLALHVNGPDEQIAFRANSSQLVEYNVFLPAPETMPDIDAELKDQPYELEGRSSSSTIPIFFILTVFIPISIEFLAN